MPACSQATSDTALAAIDADVPAGAAAVVKALRLRASYGGMQGDQAMLRRYADLWHIRCPRTCLSSRRCRPGLGSKRLGLPACLAAHATGFAAAMLWLSANWICSVSACGGAISACSMLDGGERRTVRPRRWSTARPLEHLRLLERHCQLLGWVRCTQIFW